MGIAEGLMLGSAVLGAYGANKQASAAKSAAQTQLQGTQEASALQRDMFNILNAQQAPYREAGYQGLSKIQEMLPYFTKQPTAADVQGIPGYQFGLSQGLGAINQGMNVNNPGSNATRAATKFAEDYALQSAYPLYTAQQTNIYNRLASLAGLGQQATQASGQLGQATGSNLSQLAVGGANAVAGGQVGAANAYSSGLGGLANSAMLYNLMSPTQQAAAPIYDRSVPYGIGE